MTYLFVVFCPVRAHRIPWHHLISYDPALNQRTRLVRFRACRQAQEEKGSARAGRARCRAGVAEQLQRHRGTLIGEHLKLVLSIIDRQVH